MTNTLAYFRSVSDEKKFYNKWVFAFGFNPFPLSVSDQMSVHLLKLFFSQKNLVFVHGKQFQPSLMFASKGKSVST